VMGKSSREIRADTSIGQVSPDGTQIVFRPLGTSSEPPEIWVMDRQGNNQRKVLGLPVGEWLWSIHWSPDGQRLAYIRTLPNRQVIETCDLRGANRTAVRVASGEPVMHCIYWLPDSRIIYSYLDSELWQIGVDPHSGMPRGKPKRITRWAEFNLETLSASADGKRLVLQKVTFPDQVYIAELAAGGTRIRPPKRLTNDEAHQAATAWTADSKAVLFASDRGGKLGIFKQEIGQGTAVPLVEGRDEVELPRLSPDGAWVLYRDTEVTADSRSRRYHMMRVPVNGGLPERVFESTSIRLLGDHQCARAPASLCILVELSGDEKRLTLTAFDPIKGKGKLLRSIEKPIHEDYAAQLSPDGSTYAFARGDQPEMHIRLLSLNGGSDREFTVNGWPTKASLDWSTDGKGLYIGSDSSQGATLLYVDLKGNAHVVWQSREVGVGGYIGALPSPDGRYLAIFGQARNSNAWMIEGF
jgi:Tol biopolymer transport system component